MNSLKTILLTGACIAASGMVYGQVWAKDNATINEGQARAMMALTTTGELRAYKLTSNAELRDNRPAERQVSFSEVANHARLRTGNVMFDGLYALAVHEAQLNSVSQIKDDSYSNGAPIELDAYQTGEFWTYVWTRDLAYSVHLALAGFDPERAVNSLLFKASVLKSSVVGGCTNQIIQDTGSGGSYPVSTDRIVWALGVSETLKYLHGAERESFLRKIYPILRDTIEQDRRLVFDPADGLYRGEQSFLDWREQTYPGWTKDNVLPIAVSKTLSVNAANFSLLSTAAEYANRQGDTATGARYAGWAAELKASINERFFDPEADLYSTCLLSDGVHAIRMRRYDLLGESLAILLGVADQFKAQSVLRNYPVGPHGPAVVWPQERTVPIYHNQAIWPFVTAYWIKAARQMKNCEAVNQGIRSMEHLAALNLSNMENFDFVSGRAEIKGQTLNGPVINSRRQLWSVAGYLSMVQDVVFGLETSWDGIRFQPFVTAKLRNETFASSRAIELRDFVYRNTRHHVRIHLPEAVAGVDGVCAIRGVELNGKKIGNEFVNADSLESANEWDIYLEAPETPNEKNLLRVVDVSNPRVVFGPVQPTWSELHDGAITVENGRLVLNYRHEDASKVVFNIYRDGQLCAKGIREMQWADPASIDYRDVVHFYTIEAEDAESGNASHLSPPRCYQTQGQQQVIRAKDMEHRGGILVEGHHFENWGESNHELSTKPFKPSRSGLFVIRAEFSNGAGPVNTGITCAVKRIEVLRVGTDEPVAANYLIMPQSGDWHRWDMSSPIAVNLKAGAEYLVRLCEDDYSRNMSYLKNNERYTAWQGGSQRSYNFVNIAGLHLLEVRSGSYLSQAK